MTTFQRQIGSARRLITKYGRSCIWRSLSNDSPDDASKPWIQGAEISMDYTVRVVFFPDTRSNFAFLQALSDEPVNVGDDYGLMPSVDFVPTLRSELYDEAGTTLLRGIKSITPVAPNGEIILYTLRFTVST